MEGAAPVEGEGQGGPFSPFHGPVVGVGASAGGLDALERFFGALPGDSGAAYVVVQHLSPDHKSMMDHLLSRYTAMPVGVAEEGQPLKANTVFLIPPGKTLRVAGGCLHLAPKAEHGLSLPIDTFFESLAEDAADRAVAVVLSGTGSDGARGVAAVNAAGGFVFVQDPASAKFDGMPRSAIGTGLVDVVAPAEVLAERLLTHLRTPRDAGARLPGGDPATAQARPLESILDRLAASSGIDFHEYKPTTVLRRIERRMQVLRSPSLADYDARLAASPDEQALLRRELLIPVTRFFRDAEAFEQLAEDVIPELVRGPALEPIRVWVACCATGEEAYSIAILFAEAFQRLGRSRRLKIFATDVEPAYLEQAAAGSYPDTIAAEVAAQRLEQFFTLRHGQYVVRPELRQSVIFARHNLVADPPFTRMDLVTCRNALIYLQPVAQERALRRLQYALLPGGHLLLGPSESLGVLHRDFAALPGRQKIYRLLRHDRLAIALDGGAGMRSTLLRGARRRVMGPAPDPAGGLDLGGLQSMAQRQLQQAYLPPTLLLGPTRELLHLWGQPGELLRLAEGEPTLDALKLLPRELAWAAAPLLQAAATEGRAGRSLPLRVTLADGESSRLVRLSVRPLLGAAVDATAEAAAARAGAGNAPVPLPVLLSLEPVDEPVGAVADHAATSPDETLRLRIETLERELELTHDSLQATIEELETANEELQATNEELMASNEELQSTNEELQSVNEELHTVNAEFQAKVDVLNSVNADLENITKATGIPTLFLDAALRLQRFTPELTQLFKVREGDRGRSIEDFAHQLEYPELFADLRRTLSTGTVTEREVKSRDGRWWLARMQPCLARPPGAARAVMSFVEVTSLKDSQRLQAVIDSLAEHVAVVDGQGTITLVNAAWRRFASSNGDPSMAGCGPGSNYLRVCAQGALVDGDARRAHDGLDAVLRGQRPSFTMRYPCDTEQGRLWFLMHVAPLSHPSGGAVVSHIDISEWARDAVPAPDPAPPGAKGTEAAG